LFGVADLDVSGPTLTISPSSGPPKTHVTVSGAGFTPGTTVKVVFKTGEATRPSYRICNAAVGSDGTFSCNGKIKSSRVSGAAGSHTVNAKTRHTHSVTASTTYTLSS
jgi:hypothetical protein